MQLFIFIGAALMALLVMLLPALAHKQHWNVIREDWRRPLRQLLGALNEEFGYSVIYCWPGGASGPTATNPTAAAASQVNMQQALVALGDAETFALFTHNWGLPASFPTFLFPVVMYRQSDIGTGPSTQLGNLTFILSNTNGVGIQKVAGVGSGGSFIVTLLRPTSLIR